jgi:hypothetical protein
MFIQHYGIHRAYVNLPVVNFDETIEKIASVGFESEEWNQVLQSLSLPPIATFIRFDLTKWTKKKLNHSWKRLLMINAVTSGGRNC